LKASTVETFLLVRPEGRLVTSLLKK